MNTNINEFAENTNSELRNSMSKSSLKDIQLLAQLGADLKPLSQLFGNYILERTAVLWASERGVGKSLLAIQLCIEISAEKNHFLGENIELHGNTLFVNFELAEETFMRRAHKLLGSKSLKFKNFLCHVLTTQNGLELEFDNIISHSNSLKPVLIVLDNFRSAFINSDTNSNKDIAKAMQLILQLRNELNTAILVVDHTRKHTKNLLTDSDLQSGSGVKSDLLDSDIFLRKSNQDKNFRILKRMKSRHTEEADGAKLIKLNSDSLWFELIEDNVDESEHIGLIDNMKLSSTASEKEEARKLHAQGVGQREIARQLKKSPSTINSWLKLKN